MAVGTVELVAKLKTALLAKDAEEAQRILRRLSRRVGDIGKDMSKGLTLPLALFAGASIKAATTFNRSMASIATLIPGNTKRINELARAVQDMAVTSGQSTDELATGLFNVISAYGDTAESVDQLRIANEAAIAGNAQLGDTVRLLSAVTKGFGDTSAEAQKKVTDLAFKANEIGETTFPELAASIAKAIPLSKALAVSQEELFAVFAAGTGPLGNTAEVATQLRSVLSNLAKPSADLAKLYDHLGVKSGEALIQQRGLLGALQAIAGAAEASGLPLGKFVGDVQGLTLALGLTGAQAGKYREALAQMGVSAGATAKAFAEQTGGINAFGAAIQRFKQKAIIAFQEFGNAIIEAIGPGGVEIFESFGDGLVVLARAFRDLSPETKRFIVVAGAIAAAIGPVMVAVGGLAAFLGGPLLGAISAVVAAVSVAGAAMIAFADKIGNALKRMAVGFQSRGLTGAFGALFSPGAAAKAAEETAKAIEKQTKSATGGMAAVVDEQKKSLAGALQGVEDFTSKSGRAISDVIDDLQKSLAEIEREASLAKITRALNDAISSGDTGAISAYKEQLRAATEAGVLAGYEDATLKNPRAGKIAKEIAKRKADAEIAEIETRVREANEEMHREAAATWAGTMEDIVSGKRFSFKDQWQKLAVSFGSELLAAIAPIKGEFRDIGAWFGRMLADALRGSLTATISGGGGGGGSVSIGSILSGGSLLKNVGAFGSAIKEGAGALWAGMSSGGAGWVTQGAGGVIGGIGPATQSASMLGNFGATIMAHPYLAAAAVIGAGLFAFKDSLFGGGKSAAQEARDSFRDSLQKNGNFGPNLGFAAVGGMNTMLWKGAEPVITSALAQQVQPITNAIALAVNAPSGMAEAFANAVANARNYNEALINTQSLMTALGVDAEQAKGALAKQFLLGKLAIDEFARAVEQLNFIAQDSLVGPNGIREAVEAVGQSFEESPQVAIKALELAFKEAAEQGKDQLATVEAAFVDVYGQRATAVFDAFRQSGIDSWEDFKNASIDQIVSIFSALNLIAEQMRETFRSSTSAAADAVESNSKRIREALNSTKHSRSGGEIPQFATGGLVTRPTLAVIGEAGPEMVVPLSRRAADPVVQSAQAAMMGGGGQTVNITLNVQGDERRIKQVLSEMFDRHNVRYGRGF